MTPDPLQLPGGRHAFGIEVPWLPDLVGSGVRGHSNDPVGEAFGRQVAMLRALAEGAPRTAALQLRLVVGEERRGERVSKALQVFLVLGASRPADAETLRRHVLATLPPELPATPLAFERLQELLQLRQEWTGGSIMELRRAVESAEPELEGGSHSQQLAAPVLLRWEWTRFNLLTSMSALLALPEGAQLVVHVEPRPVSAAALAWLRDEVEAYRKLVTESPQTLPLLSAALQGYLRWMRDLPRSCLHLRVALFCSAGVPPGVPEVVGADLTRSWEARGSGGMVGTFEVLAPASTIEVERTLMLLQQLRSEPAMLPQQPEVAELLFLFDPHEANAAFRIPLPGPEGLPGVRIAPVSRLPLGLPAGGRPTGAAVRLGSGASGQEVGLSLDELNRHLLVCGLPGFGKTTSLQSLLLQLWRLPEPVPFLVIDPAKEDYRGLMAELGGEVADLTPERLAFNPLVAPPGVPVHGFANRIAAAFDAAFSLSEAFPVAAVVLTRAVHAAFEASRATTLHRLYALVGDLIDSSSYNAEVKGNLRAALLGRLELVIDGSMGVALAGSLDAGVPWERLLGQPTVVQLRHFTSPRERALLVALLMAGWVSYREYHPLPRLGHVTVLEEAHRVLGRVGTGTSEGARTFIDAMAELRGAGEGIVVVEQAPSRLAPEVLKLVGSLLAHRLVDAEERRVMADSMLMSGGEEDLARLQVGAGVLLAADAVAPTIVQVEAHTDTRTAPPAATVPTLAQQGQVVRLWCQECPVMCRGSEGLRHLAVVGESAVQALREAADAVGRSAATAPHAYCLAAFSLAQASANHQHWRVRRRELQAAYRGAVGGGGR